jgi:hypothetical protein
LAVQLVGHPPETPLQRNGEQLGEALAVPEAKTVHVPVPLLHESQPPEQSVLQHVPSAHAPDVHCVPSVQTAPLAFFAVHAPALQYALDEQSPSTAQLVGQAAALPLHTYRPQPGLAPGLPGPEREHVPVVHASHPPLHAALQHTPSAQKPDTHSPAPPQAWPLVFFATQALLLQ